MFVTVLPKDKCIGIAKIVGHEETSNDSLLLYLPDEIFGNTHRVDYIAKDIYVRANDNQKDWAIPTYFIDNIDKW